MFQKRNEENGITLMALVLTIIILLILAGISISMLTGNNGILRKTIEAKEKSQNAEQEEKNNIKEISSMMDKIFFEDVVGNESDWEIDKEEQSIIKYNGQYNQDTIVIPNKVGNTYIKKIGNGTNAIGFNIEDAKGIKIKISEGIEKIESVAFYYSVIGGNVKFPESLKEIGDSAFSNCKYITGDLEIPDNVEKIGSFAFYYATGLNGTLKLSKALKTIGGTAFGNCAFNGSLEIPDNVEKIGENAFSSNNFTGTLIIGKSVKEIGAMSFSGNKFLGNLIIPKSVKKIGMAVFPGSTFDSIKIENYKEDIDVNDMAFVGMGNNAIPQYLE